MIQEYKVAKHNHTEEWCAFVILSVYFTLHFDGRQHNKNISHM